MALSEQLLHLIGESGESLYAVAKGSGVDYSALNRFANGKRSLSLESVDKLARYFGVSLTR